MDSFITVRRAIARAISSWLPRCPFCHHANTQPRGSPSRILRNINFAGLHGRGKTAVKSIPWHVAT
jgi:hypothetical protein